MANIRIFSGILAALTASLTISACSSTPDYVIPDGPELYCVGPEQGLFSDPADMVRYPDDPCAGPLPPRFALVSAPSWSDVPDIGEVVYTDAYYGYRRGPVRTYGRHHTVVVVRNAPTPPPVKTRVLITRDPTVGSSTARSQAATRSSAARTAASRKPDSVAPAARPAGNPNIQRGGLGVSPNNSQSGSVRQADAGLNKSSASKSSGSKSSSSSGSSSRSSSGSSSKSGK